MAKVVGHFEGGERVGVVLATVEGRDQWASVVDGGIAEAGGLRIKDIIGDDAVAVKECGIIIARSYICNLAKIVLRIVPGGRVRWRICAFGSLAGDVPVYGHVKAMGRILGVEVSIEVVRSELKLSRRRIDDGCIEAVLESNVYGARTMTE